MGREQGALGVWARLADGYQEAGTTLGQVASNREKTGVFVFSNRMTVKIMNKNLQHDILCLVVVQVIRFMETSHLHLCLPNDNKSDGKTER